MPLVYVWMKAFFGFRLMVSDLTDFFFLVNVKNSMVLFCCSIYFLMIVFHNYNFLNNLQL